MPTPIGHLESIFRYPVKSLAGERLELADLGWHGLDGDRRLAFRRVDDRSGFPWLNASKLPELLLYAAERPEIPTQTTLPTHIRTPDGTTLPIFSEALAAHIGDRHGAPVQMMQMKHGIFDEAAISLITSATIQEIADLTYRAPDPRCFRPNLVIHAPRARAFVEDAWVGGVLSFGTADGPAIAITMRDLRCSMLNLDPDSARSTPEVLKAVARANDSHAGVYSTVTRVGKLAVGQPVFFHAHDASEPANEPIR